MLQLNKIYKTNKNIVIGTAIIPKGSEVQVREQAGNVIYLLYNGFLYSICNDQAKYFDEVV